MPFSSKPQAWVYPGVPAQNAMFELQDGRKLYCVKPESHTIDSTGAIVLTGVGLANECTPANLVIYKNNAKEVFATISGNYPNANALLSNPTKYANAITVLVNYANTNNLQGIELDWEQYASWTLAHTDLYKQFVNDLAIQLHKYGRKLMIDAPAISGTLYQSFYPFFKYEDFNSSALDYVCIMAYDYQYDYGGGSPVAPLTWLSDIMTWANNKIIDKNRIICGLPSYGYHAAVGNYTIAIDTKTQSATVAGYNQTTNATLDAERYFDNAGQRYFYQTSTGLNTKRQTIEAGLAKSISVWHLGGNDWFNNVSQPETFETLTTLALNSTPTVSSTIGQITTFVVSYQNTGTQSAYQLKCVVNIPTAYSTIEYSYNNLDWFAYTTQFNLPTVDQSSTKQFYIRATATTNGTYSNSITLTGGNINSTNLNFSSSVGTVVVIPTGATNPVRAGKKIIRNGKIIQK